MSFVLGASEAVGVLLQAEEAAIAVLVGPDGSMVGPGSRDVQQYPAELGTKRQDRA